MNDLKKRFIDVPGSYEDFVKVILHDMKDNPEIIQPVLDFINEDATRDSSDVLGFVNELLGISEPLEIIDDEDMEPVAHRVYAA